METKYADPAIRRSPTPNPSHLAHGHEANGLLGEQAWNSFCAVAGDVQRARHTSRGFDRVREKVRVLVNLAEVLCASSVGQHKDNGLANFGLQLCWANKTERYSKNDAKTGQA